MKIVYNSNYAVHNMMHILIYYLPFIKSNSKSICNHSNIKILHIIKLCINSNHNFVTVMEFVISLIPKH